LIELESSEVREIDGMTNPIPDSIAWRKQPSILCLVSPKRLAR
jgi:hypothetical protein